jgi:putative endonuclease
MKGFLYILQSQKNNRYYIGSTTSVRRRLSEHNQGKSPYTRSTRPWKVVYQEEFDTIMLARQKEHALKKLKSRNILNDIIISDSSHSSVG